MVILRSWRVDEEETVISLRSVLHPHAPPTPTQYIRSEILSSGYIIRDVSPANSIPTPKAKSLFSRSSSSPSSPSSHFSYIVQLGPKALKLFVDYMTGDAENSLDHTLAKLFSVAE